MTKVSGKSEFYNQTALNVDHLHLICLTMLISAAKPLMVTTTSATGRNTLTLSRQVAGDINMWVVPRWHQIVNLHLWWFLMIDQDTLYCKTSLSSKPCNQFSLWSEKLFLALQNPCPAQIKSQGEAMLGPAREKRSWNLSLEGKKGGGVAR